MEIINSKQINKIIKLIKDRINLKLNKIMIIMKKSIVFRITIKIIFNNKIKKVNLVNKVYKVYKVLNFMLLKT